MWGAGISQGLLWFSLDSLGELRYSFTDIMAATNPYYVLRLVAGIVFLSGTLLMAYNLTRTVAGRKTVVARPPLLDGEHA
ncbi:MAG: hypothetical protein HOM16_01070 [Woeseia sp.]|nr:hypothetical protein [Woeseia sp.]